MIVGIDFVRTRREVPQGMKGQYAAIQRSPGAVASAALLSVCLRSVRGGTMRKAARACNPPNWGGERIRRLMSIPAGLARRRNVRGPAERSRHFPQSNAIAAPHGEAGRRRAGSTHTPLEETPARRASTAVTGGKWPNAHITPKALLLFRRDRRPRRAQC